MNKTAIKNYAIWARVQLIEAAKQRAFEYEITESGENRRGLSAVGGRMLTKTEKEQRDQLISEFNRKGYFQVMEEAAYTWFNRFIALRFMEVNGYLPSRVRVFTDETGAFKPELLKQAMTVELEGLDRARVLDLLDKQDNEALYKYLLITQCNALNAGLPYMFEKIGGWTELLFPANLLRPDSVIGQMISEIPEEDWTDAVQIIGWMYQYYNSELKDDTFALLKKNVKITKERIPAATQLFTPDWIVRYMVENSLGRLWYEGHPDFDKSPWKYYLDEAEQDPEVEAQLQKIRAEYATIKPEEIKVIDPCMGSGHILVYAFDVLMQIYTSAGWSERGAAKSILENNLYGLDIDDRAGQLAYFAVMMKARKHSRRILNGDVEPNVLSIQDSNWMTDEFIAYVAGKDATMKADLTMLRKTFRDAKEYGSILEVPVMQYDALYERIDILSRSYAENLFQVQYHNDAVNQLLPLVKQSQIMSQKYAVVVTNPPYMGLRNMSKKLFDYVMSKHKDTKQDLFGVFMKICMDNLCENNGKTAMITQHVWMFTSGFEAYRKSLYASKTISSMVHLGTRAFEEISGEVVQTCTFVVENSPAPSYKGTYVRLVNYNSALEKETHFFNPQNYYYSESDNFLNIPGAPVCYWLSSRIIEVFRDNPLVGDVSNTRQGLKTSDDKRFIRLFFEVSDAKIARETLSLSEAASSGKKWFWLNKGGQVKWYGNNVFLINWENDGKEVKDYATQVAGSYSKNITAIDAYFKHCISWPQISLSHPSFRYMPDGYIFASAGPSLFVDNEEQKWYMLGLLNSTVTQSVLDAINPTINFGVSDILKVPYIYDPVYKEEIDALVKRAIDLATESWNSYEISWDFKKHPLISGHGLIKDAFTEWSNRCNNRFNELKGIEQKLNALFCNIYGLTDELDSSVDESTINVTRAELRSDIVGLISYAVGCMFGRYSLDKEGVIYAGGNWNDTNYHNFQPDQDGIIPICDDEYFEDDVVGRFVDFIKLVYGEKNLEQNLKYIADALGGKGSSREVIRDYFLNDFYADHCSIYSVSGSGKRPIYWLFSSGKKNGFKALVYMHRYQPDLLARMRTDYVHEQQERYRTQLQMLEISVQSVVPSERVKLNRQIAKLKDQALEIQKYEEKIHHLADQMISIDLDDGVKANYAKFAEVLEKI